MLKIPNLFALREVFQPHLVSPLSKPAPKSAPYPAPLPAPCSLVLRRNSYYPRGREIKGSCISNSSNAPPADAVLTE